MIDYKCTTPLGSYADRVQNILQARNDNSTGLVPNDQFLTGMQIFIIKALFVAIRRP